MAKPISKLIVNISKKEIAVIVNDLSPKFSLALFLLIIYMFKLIIINYIFMTSNNINCNIYIVKNVNYIAELCEHVLV